MKTFKEFLEQKMYNEEMDMQPTPAMDTNPAIVKPAQGNMGSMKSYMPTKFPHNYTSVFEQPVMAVQQTLTNATDYNANDPMIKHVVSVIKKIPESQLNKYDLTKIDAIKKLYLGHDDSLTGRAHAIRDEEYINKKKNWGKLELSIMTKDSIDLAKDNH